MIGKACGEVLRACFFHLRYLNTSALESALDLHSSN
jgi:hypothetical protein